MPGGLTPPGQIQSPGGPRTAQAGWGATPAAQEKALEAAKAMQDGE